jgi:hypothetical protein
MTALTPRGYFRSNWNIFDFLVVSISVIEFIIAVAGGALLSALNVLRSFRVLRIFRLASSYPTLQILVTVVFKTLASIRNLLIILLVFLCICSLMALHLFGFDEKPDHFVTPDWNFIV